VIRVALRPLPPDRSPHFPLVKFSPAVFCALLALLSACTTPPKPRPLAPAIRATEFWLDLVSGDEVTHQEVIDDLATAGVIYVGETHTIARHHAMQRWLLRELFTRGVPLVLCLEQLEARDQPAVDRYNRREIDFETLAKETDWTRKWGNYPDYRGLCEFARQHGIPIHALNAPADLIRAVNRGGGLAQLPPDQRAQLPMTILTDDPVYERLMTLQLAVHMAVDPAKLRPLFEAQVARDETMAENIVDARRRTDGPPRTAFVVLGAGHIRFGLGTAARVRMREPGITERVILVTESGQLQLSAAEQAASRDITISHADLRALGLSPGDYLRVLPKAQATELPPGHPPIGH